MASFRVSAASYRQRVSRARVSGGFDSASFIAHSGGMHLTLIALLFAAAPDLAPVHEQITRRHAEAVERLQKWIALPSIAAEGRNTEEGVQRMIELLRDAGFQCAENLIESSNPKLRGYDDAVQSFVDYLYELAR